MTQTVAYLPLSVTKKNELSKTHAFEGKVWKSNVEPFRNFEGTLDNGQYYMREGQNSPTQASNFSGRIGLDTIENEILQGLPVGLEQLIHDTRNTVIVRRLLIFLQEV